MKKRALFITAVCLLLSGAAGLTEAGAQQRQESAAGSAAFPDTVFRAAVYSQADLDGDGALSREELEGLKELEVKYPYQDGKESYPHAYDGVAVDVTGIECFPNLKILSFENVEPAGGLSVKKLEKLETFRIKTAPEMELDFSGARALKKIEIGCMKLKKLDVSGCGVTRIDIGETEFTGPFAGFEGADSLQSVYLFGTNLKELDFSLNAGLKKIIMGQNPLKKLNLAGLEKLEWLQVADAALKSIDVSENKHLKALILNGNRLAKIDVSRNYKLKNLDIGKNLFTKINSKTLKVSDKTSLKALSAPGMSGCTVLDISYIKPLKSVNASDCGLHRVKIGKKLTRIDIDNNKGMAVLDKNSFQAPEGAKLYELHCTGAGLKELNARHLKELYILYADRNKLKQVDVSGNQKLYDLGLDQNPLEVLTVSKNSSSSQKKKYQRIIKENGGKIVYKK